MDTTEQKGNTQMLKRGSIPQKLEYNYKYHALSFQ